MNINLQTWAGFSLSLDTDRLSIETGNGVCFERVSRSKATMRLVLSEPEAIPDDTELYLNFPMKDAGQHEELFKRFNLTFACVLLPPLKVGHEYVKTHGHYHPNMPGSSIAYPEVYTHYYGKLYLLMQRRVGEYPDKLEDCAIYEMQPGKSITIPPGYFHILINASDQPALMAGLFCKDSFPQYEPITQMAGAAYYLVEEGGKEKVIANPRYSAHPPLCRLSDLTGSRFMPPHDDTPLWSAFINDPQSYAMLSDPLAAQRYFFPEGSA